MSLRRILIGFGIGTVAGVVIGAGMSASRVVRHLVDAIMGLALDAGLRGMLYLADPSRRG